LTLKRLKMMTRSAPCCHPMPGWSSLSFFLESYASEVGRDGDLIHILTEKIAPEDHKAKAKAELSKKGIHLTESGKLTIDLKKWMLDLEKEWFPEAVKEEGQRPDSGDGNPA
jgi:hypothetical protein